MHIHLETSTDSQRNLYQIKNKKNRTVIPPPTANHVVEFSVCASFLYLADIIERFCDLLSNSESTAPRCRTSSMFCTMIRCTSCSSLLSALRFLFPRLSAYVLLAFWM